MANQWFKFYGGEYLSDPKMLALTASERSCWLTLLAYVSMSGKKGVIEYLDEEMLMAQSGISPVHEEWNGTKGVLKKLEKLKIITISNDKITLLNWEKRQETLLTGAERAKRYREKHKEDNEEVTEKSDESNARIEENRIEENRIESKDTYGEFENVKLKPEEYSKLKERINEKNTKILIEELSRYLESTNKRYKSHYATLLNWASRKYKEHAERVEKNYKGKKVE